MYTVNIIFPFYNFNKMLKKYFFDLIPYVNKCVDQKILISSPKQAIFDLQSTFLRCLMKN